MGRLGFVSDQHMITPDASLQKARFEGHMRVVHFFNGRGADTLVNGGDVDDGHGTQQELSSVLEQFQELDAVKKSGQVKEYLQRLDIKISEEQFETLYKNVQEAKKQILPQLLQQKAQKYAEYDQISAEFNGNLEAIVGNHDLVGFDTAAKHWNFAPNDQVGKYFIQTGPPKGPLPQDLFYNDSPNEYLEQAIAKKPPIMLWHHFGKLKTKFFDPSNYPRAQEVDARINLYGHVGHPSKPMGDEAKKFKGFDVRYSAATDTLDVNVSSIMGYFAEVDYDDKTGSFEYVRIYRDEDVYQAFLQDQGVSQKAEEPEQKAA